MKKLKSSKRGLTFSLDPKEAKIGEKYRYIVDLKNNEIIISPDENGSLTASRKRSGKQFKPLFDIRSKEVKDLCASADYMEVEAQEDNTIIVKVFKEVHSLFQVVKNKILNIQDIITAQTGEIVIKQASGSYPQMLFGKPTIANDDYFSYLCKSLPTSYSNKKKQELKKIYDVVSLFSGAGLLDYSFKDPRIRFVYGVDFNKDACETYRQNIGDHIVCDDIRNVEAKDIPKADIVIGGPCCQGYSNANRRDIDKDTAKAKRLLIDDYIRIVKAKQPYVFVIENVPQLLTKEDGLYINKVLTELADYDITCKVIADNEVGGYTLRKRAIVIGSRIGRIELPDKTFTTVHTVREALSGVDATWYNYEDVTTPKADTLEKMKYVPQGGNWKDIPEEIGHFNKNTHSDRYRRLSWDEQSPTIVNWRKVILMPPEGNRILNVSEAAALMGLDKSFHIHGTSLDAKQQQVGNGVTQAIGRFVRDVILDAMDTFFDKKIVQFC